MTADEWRGIVKYIEGVWRRELSDITAAAWGASLFAYAVEDVMAAVANLAKSPETKFLPSLAEIIEATREQADIRFARSSPRQLETNDGITLAEWLDQGCPGLEGYFPNLKTADQRRQWALDRLPFAPSAVKGPWD